MRTGGVTRTRLLAVAVVAAAWSSAGCMANPEPAPLVVATPAPPTPPPTSSAAPTPSPRPSATASPRARSSTKPQPAKQRPTRSTTRPSRPVTATDVAAAVRSAGLPRLTVVTQPSPRTRVGIDTVFYTRPVTYSRTFTLRGDRVEVRARPISFRWDFGDGSTRTTSAPGAPYPHHTLTHRYRSAGTRYASVTTRYGVTYRVGAGAWQSLSGSWPTTGPGTRVQVVTKA